MSIANTSSTETVQQYLKRIGTKGGCCKSPAKRRASRKSIKKALAARWPKKRRQ